MLEAKVKYIDPEMKENPELHLRHIGGDEHSNWIDVRASVVEVNGKIEPWKPVVDPKTGKVTYSVSYPEGAYIRVFLGFAMELPKGHEAIVGPRGGTFKNFGIIQTNSKGVVDESFKGDGDQWFVPFWSLRDGTINKHDRVAQFRIQEKMPKLNLTVVDVLGNDDRGGHSSTGVK